MILLPQGLRTSLANNQQLTRFFLFFDDARYVALKDNQRDKVSGFSEDDVSAVIPVSEYQFAEPQFTVKTERDLSNFPNETKISIIMAVFNVDPDWLKLAVQSVERQWYKQWELCIVDDNSQNIQTLEYFRSIQNPKIRVYRSLENKGISTASNMALSHVTGDYVALMDHDDELTPDALFEVVKAIHEHKVEFI